MNTPPEGEQIGHPDLLQTYENIVIKLKHSGKFEESDIDRNQICEAESLMDPPESVTTFEQGLARKPCLHHHVRCFLDLSVCGSILTGL